MTDGDGRPVGRPLTRAAALLAAALASLVWLAVGFWAGIDYGTADAGTARAEAPDLAVMVVAWVPVAGAVLLVGAAASSGGPSPYRARRSAAGAALCLLAWGVARVVLTGY